MRAGRNRRFDCSTRIIIIVQDCYPVIRTKLEYMYHNFTSSNLMVSAIFTIMVYVYI